jgi:sulfofructosephosphate aldolase
LMLALDHRGSFKKLMNHDNPDSVTDEAAASLKGEIIAAVESQMSGVLIDKDLGLAGYKNPSKPYLLPLEKSGYTDSLGERITELEFSAQNLKDLGAKGAKILLYVNPDVPSLKQQLETAKRALADCHARGIPLFLEIRVYDPKTGDEVSGRVEDLVLRSIKAHLDAGIVPDVWKLEFPESAEACKKVTELVGQTPWILLTKGSTFDTFVEQLKQAHVTGAQGFLAGRALWQEVCGLQGDEKQKFLKETLPSRFSQIAAVFKE